MVSEAILGKSPFHPKPFLEDEIFTGWWFFLTHLKNMRKSNWIMKPQFSAWKSKKYFKTPPRLYLLVNRDTYIYEK